jgi:hypothetical protein
MNKFDAFMRALFEYLIAFCAVSATFLTILFGLAVFIAYG